MKRLVLLATFSAALALLFRNVYGYFVVNGLQAEAKIMLSFLHSLEIAHYTESSRYVAFTAYGAPKNGNDQCMQPAGAEELGFLLKDCQKKQISRTMRYYYEVALENKGLDFHGRATSGSTEDSQSLICLNSLETDVWSVKVDKDLKQIQSCN
ncbi:MAG: hypothetical protein AB7T49_04335 [Oligoflexales bacterium]